MKMVFDEDEQHNKIASKREAPAKDAEALTEAHLYTLPRTVYPDDYTRGLF